MKLWLWKRGARIDSVPEVDLRDMQEERILEWQQFLARKESADGRKLYEGPQNGRYSEALFEATKKFQNPSGSPENTGSGKLDRKTIERALSDPQWPGVSMFPGNSDDFRRNRPYFLIPVLESRFPFEQQILKDKILGAINAMRAKEPVTDIFILSHGWHRNFLTGVAAYDRLMSRLFVMFRRGRIQPPADFSPLFLCAHWNSDPGPDLWMDMKGRRDKASFMEKARELFDDTVPGFENDFEDLFHELMLNCAPDTAQIPANIGDINAATSNLSKYDFRGCASNATLDEKICAVWRCYFEADNKAFLVDQTEKPRPVGSPLTAVASLVKFVLAASGISIGLGFFLDKAKGLAPKVSVAEIEDALEKLWSWLTGPGQHPYVPDWTRIGWCALDTVLVAAGGMLLLWIFHAFRYSKRQRAKRTTPAKGFPIVQALAWAAAQVVCTLPILSFLLVTYLFRSPYALLSLIPLLLGYPGIAIWMTVGFVVLAYLLLWAGIPLSGVFRERLVHEEDEARNARDWLAMIARWPVRLLQKAVGPDSSLYGMASGLDNQLAFFAMQRKGVRAGAELGIFIRDLVRGIDGGDKIRIHLVGHSFGGLVVLNAARTIVQTPPAGDGMLTRLFWASKAGKVKPRTKADQLKVASVITIQGAIASDWYDKEDHLVANTTGTIATIFSAYDTANGFYYPCANNGRLASGFVGMCEVGPPPPPRIPYYGRFGVFASLVKPISLNPPPQQVPRLMNLDGSRMICDGPPGSGGGHDDVFKDDVVNLVWSAIFP